ncbi:hypothetical protein AAG906_021584 [Vitis piasezkii]
MQSRREKRQIVVLVFYHVDPFDVRKQTGSFGEAFARSGEVIEDSRLSHSQPGSVSSSTALIIQL